MTSNLVFHSRRKAYFRILLIIFILSLWLLWFFLWSMFLTNKEIAKQQLLINKQNEELAWSKTWTWYLKLEAIKQLENMTNTMPRSEHINKVINMLNNLKQITPNQSWSIVLSDFKVSLESVSLRWKVSNLMLLYYSNPSKNILSLFDKFEQLDFIKDIRVKTYTKTDDSFDFVLDAKVINNEK